MTQQIQKSLRVSLFLDNIERLWPNEIAACFGVRLKEDASLVIPKELGGLVGGCVLIAVALDLASSAARGLKWNETSGQKRSYAMKMFVEKYYPSKYRKFHWYRDFRNGLVHNFCPKNMELVHAEEHRSSHLKKISARGKQRDCIHVFELLTDTVKAFRSFAQHVRKEKDLFKKVKRFTSHYGVLEPRDPD